MHVKQLHGKSVSLFVPERASVNKLNALVGVEVDAAQHFRNWGFGGLVRVLRQRLGPLLQGTEIEGLAVGW